MSFLLASYASGTGPFVAIVVDDAVFDLTSLHAIYTGSARRQGALARTDAVMGLLEDWQPAFTVLESMAAFIREERVDSDRLANARRWGPLRPLPPIPNPSKLLNCAANYSGHLAEMRSYSGKDIDPATLYRGDKSSGEPYLFLKATSSLSGAFDDIVMPTSETQLDWEAELAVVIDRRCRNVGADGALDCIAGYMTFNDVSSRNALIRGDRPNFRTDWLSSKSHDTFGPCGPYFVPRQFVPHHGALRIRLSVNGEVKQAGLAGDMIYSPEEQIEYASRMMTLMPGDIFATGTLAGVGQGTGVFLKPGDLVETEVVGLGMQRNRVVAAPTR